MTSDILSYAGHPDYQRVSTLLVAASDFVPHPHHWIVVTIDDPFLQRNDAVICDVDVFWADLGAASGDIAHTGAKLLFDLWDTVGAVERMHLETGEPDHEARAYKLIFLLVVTQHMADVLAQIALDALAKLLDAIDVRLFHAVLSIGVSRLGLERCDFSVLLEIPGNIGDQVLDDRE